MANLTDADKVLRNDTGKQIVAELVKIANGLNTPDADKVAYDNTTSGLTADNVQDAIDEVEGRVNTAEGSITSLDSNKLDKNNPTSTGALSHTGDATISGTVTTNDGFVGNLTGTASNANTVNNLTVLTAVPANAVFTDTDELADLKDVDFENLADGQVIIWNATAGKFKNITLPDPMVFRGSLGTGGTIETLPVDGTARVGDTYKVITDGTYAGQTAKVGDTFICLTKTLGVNTWVHIPSGDEPSGTVTSVKIEANSPIVVDDDSAITTSGVRKLSHANSGATAGSYGDSTAQTPEYGTTFKVPYITVDAKGHITGISEHTVKIPDSDNTDTTYTLTQDSSDGHKITLTPSEGTAQTITIPDNDTTYTLGTNGNNLKLTPSSGSAQTVTVPYATNAGKVNSHTVNSDVPSGAVFTDTTNASGISYDPTTSGLSATDAQDAIDELRGLDPQVKSASGSIATFTDGGDNIPVKSFECEIVAQQESGTPTPSSPLPISGFSQADISVCGINFWDEEWELGNINGNTGVDVSANNRFRTKNYIPVKPSTTYFCVGVGKTGAFGVACFYDSSKTFISGIYPQCNQPITTPANAYYVRFSFYISFGTSYNNDISINYPSTDTQYHAYNGNLYTVAFGQTIYGGRLVYSNGQWAIEATHEILTLDGTENVSIVGSGTQRRFNCGNYPIYSSILSSSHFIESVSNSNPWGYYRFVSSTLLLMDNNTQMADETALKTWLANQYSGGTPAQFLCELATPVIIPITSSTRVKTISGVNNIFSNTGDVELEYFTDGCDSIVELVEQVVAYTEVTGTLTAGQTSITLSDASITSSSHIEVFASNGNVNYTSISATTGSVTIGFLAQASDMTVTVRIS